MKKRLYEPTPEQSALIDNVHLARKEKATTRFYTANIVYDNNGKVEEESKNLDSFSDFLALTVKQLDTFYEFCDFYEKECRKIPFAMASSLSDTTSASIKFLDWYMSTTKSVWEKSLEYSYTPFSWPK